MSGDRIIPTGNRTSVVTVTLLVEGAPVSPSIELLSIMTEKEANRVPYARVSLRDGDAAAEDFPVSNEDSFAPGKTLEIKAGYDAESLTIFRGLIVKHGIKMRGRGASALVVECRDAAVKMTIGRRSRHFFKKTDGDIIKQLIGDNGLRARVDATQPTYPEMTQFHVSDWDFVLSRADANGLLVIADDGALSVQAPKLDGKADVALRYGDTVYELDLEIDARRQFDAVRAYAWDYGAQDVASAKGRRSSTSAQGNLSEQKLAATIGLDEDSLRHGGRRDAAELGAWADARLLRSSLAKIVGRARVLGLPSAKPGQLAEVNGMGERFNGTAYVAAVRHELVGGAWYTDLQFGLPPVAHARRPEVMDAPAAGLVPAVQGLQIGIATKLEGDPDGEDRIKVRLPLVDPREDGVWARWACPDAGAGRGVFFRPEIGDEVIVGFLADDPRDPVVLGMVHSSKHPAPIQPTDQNPEKAVVTRSELRLHFDDDNKVITVETPGGNKAVLSDADKAITLEDQHGNSVVLNSDGIALSGSAIMLKADQAIEIKAGTDLKANSGTNTEIAAGTQLKAQGSAGAELKSSAILTIQGSLVKIN